MEPSALLAVNLPTLHCLVRPSHPRAQCSGDRDKQSSEVPRPESSHRPPPSLTPTQQVGPSPTTLMAQGQCGVTRDRASPVLCSFLP